MSSKDNSVGHYQNWNPTIIRLNQQQKKNVANTGKKPTKVVKDKFPKNKNNMNTLKLEKTDELKHNYIPKNIAKEIQQMRSAKGWSQKELAQKLQIKPQEIQLIEQSKAIYNKQMISKIKRKLSS